MRAGLTERMKKALLAAACLIFLLLPAAGAGEIQDIVGVVDSAALIKKARLFDGRTVTYRGEVIGDVMVRSDGVWLNVNDDAYSRQGERFVLAGYNQGMSVLAPPGTEDRIKRAGRYDWRGDYIEVEGTFRRSSAQHGGTMLIEARSVKVLKPGFRLEHPISRNRLVVAGGLLAVASLVLWISSGLSRARRRRSRPLGGEKY